MYTINQLWIRYFFNRDIGDINRANYWLKRIEEYNQEYNQTNKEK
jgi:hypothetical protein